MRVLVTGSRTWRNGRLLYEKLADCRSTCVDTDDELLVVHGGASGADSMAAGWCRWHYEHSTHVAMPEVHQARWEAPCRDRCIPNHRRRPSQGTVISRRDLPPGWDVCPKAGIYRNEEMVALGADLCLAFIADNSRGATHCARLAGEAGIHVIPFRTTSGPEQLQIPLTME